MTPNLSCLFSPTTLGPLELRNRFIRAAAFEGMSPGGEPSPQLIAYHRAVAAGGVGMTTVAYAAVQNGGRTFAHQLWMRPEILPGLRRLTDTVHSQGAAVAIQLGHGGNMADRDVTGQRPFAPSAVFTLFGLALPRAMSEAQIDALVQDFARSVRLAREAGFDAVELQAGHGYLLSQFLSPHTNRRTDRFGGSLENRARLSRRVLRAALEAAGPEMAVVVKTNLRDGFSGGVDLEECIAFAKMLEEDGAHGLVLSGGFVSKNPMYLMRGEIPLKEMVQGQRAVGRKVGLALFGKVMVKAYPFTEAYFFDDALQMRRQVSLPLVLVGGLRTVETMTRAVEQGFDALALARPLFREPDFVDKLRRGERTASICEPCNKCMATMYFGPATCPEREEEQG